MGQTYDCHIATELTLKKIGLYQIVPDSTVHGANMGPTWVLSAPDGPHVGPMNLVIRVVHHSWELLQGL